MIGEEYGPIDGSWTGHSAICQILLPRYKNVKLLQGLTNNKPHFRIQVKGLFGTEEKRFEVVGGDKKRPATKKKSDLGWIDRLEGEAME